MPSLAAAGHANTVSHDTISGRFVHRGVPPVIAHSPRVRTLLGVDADAFYEDQRGIGLKVLAGEGSASDTSRSSGKLVFGIFAALAEFERELSREPTLAGLAAPRARARRGGRPYKMTEAKIRLAMAWMGQPDTTVGDLCKELGVSRQTLYRHVSPTGELRDDGRSAISKTQVTAPDGQTSRRLA